MQRTQYDPSETLSRASTRRRAAPTLYLPEQVEQLLRRRRQRAAAASDQPDLARDHRVDQRHAHQQRMVGPGIAIDGTAATPSPASTRPSIVVTCCVS